MVIDTSAVVAFLRSEPEADAIEEVLVNTVTLSMSAFSALESRVVLHRRFGPRAVADFDLLVSKAGIEIVAFDAEQADLATQAYRRYGKGSGHPARFNLGDCASYALAQKLRRPLLFKGNDFGHTDVEPVLVAG